MWAWCCCEKGREGDPEVTGSGPLYVSQQLNSECNSCTSSQQNTRSTLIWIHPLQSWVTTTNFLLEHAPEKYQLIFQEANKILLFTPNSTLPERGSEECGIWTLVTFLLTLHLPLWAGSHGELWPSANLIVPLGVSRILSLGWYTFFQVYPWQRAHGHSSVPGIWEHVTCTFCHQHLPSFPRGMTFMLGITDQVVNRCDARISFREQIFSEGLFVPVSHIHKVIAHWPHTSCPLSAKNLQVHYQFFMGEHPVLPHLPEQLQWWPSLQHS